MTDLTAAERIREAHEFWTAVSSGDYSEWERHVRRDQHRLDAQVVAAMSRDLAWTVNRLNQLTVNATDPNVKSFAVDARDLATLNRVALRLANLLEDAAQRIEAA